MAHAPLWLTYGFTYLAAAVIAVPITRALGLGAIGFLTATRAVSPPPPARPPVVTPVKPKPVKPAPAKPAPTPVRPRTP